MYTGEIRLKYREMTDATGSLRMMSICWYANTAVMEQTRRLFFIKSVPIRQKKEKDEWRL